IEDTATTQGVAVDKAGYELAMEGQRDKARAKSGFKAGSAAVSFTAPPGTDLAAVGDSFAGYETTCVNGAQVVALFSDAGASVEYLETGQTGYASLNKTPFYLESGGQVSDIGEITNAYGGLAVVESIVKTGLGPRAHRVRVKAGSFKTGDIVTATV